MAEKIKVKIFVASSHHAKTLATKFAKEVEKYGNGYGDIYDFELKPLLWWTTLAGNYILNSVRKEMKKCHFSAILLTQEQLDMSQKQIADQRAGKADKRVLHYNPIFEAGLFIGDVDDHERCFLLANCNKDDLFSDIDGLVHIPIRDDDSIEAAAKQVYDKVQEFAIHGKLRAVRGLKCDLLEMQELYNREKIKGDKDHGGLAAQGAVVFVNTPRPVEWQNKEFALRVVGNMVTQQFRYTYFFSDYRNIQLMGMGIVFLLSVLKEFDRDKFDENLPIVAENLNIYFTSAYDGIEFCIHDAESGASAKCYMRSKLSGDAEPEWINWVEGSQAANFVKLIELIKDKDENPRRRIFHNTSDERTRVLRDEYRTLTDLGSELKRAIEAAPKFREFSQAEKQEILDACFYGMKGK